MATEQQTKEDLSSFSIRTMRSDIARLGGDWKTKSVQKPTVKSLGNTPQAPPPPPTQPQVQTQAPAYIPIAQIPISKASPGTEDKDNIRQVNERAIERLERLKQEGQAKKLALLEVEKLQKEKRELEIQKQLATKQEKEKDEQLRAQEDAKKAQEQARLSIEREKELQITRQKEEAQRKILEEKFSKEREAIELEQETIAMERELLALEEEKKPFEEERNIFLEKERQLTKNIADIIDREDTIEKDQKNIEAIEKLSEQPEERKVIEEKRWQMEEKRRKIEKERWEWEEELAKVKDQFREIELKYQKIFSREKEIQSKKRVAKERQEELKIEQEKEILQKRLKEIKLRKAPLEQERGTLLEKQKQAKQRLEEIALQEAGIEKEQIIIEEEESQAKMPADKKAAEIKRWTTEEKRRRTEKERWALETETKEIAEELSKTQSNYQKLLNEEIEVERKLGIRKEIKIIPKQTEVEPLVDKPIQENTTTKQKPEQPHKTELEKFMEQVRKETEERRKTKQLTATSEEKNKPTLDKTPITQIKEPSTAKEEQEDIHKAIARLRKEVEGNKKTINAPQTTQEKLESIVPEKKFYIEESTPQTPLPRFEESPTNDTQTTEASLRKQESEIRKRLSEIQAEEEKERQRFLGRIQGGSQENLEDIAMPKNPSIATPEPIEAIRPLPQRQSDGTKIFTRILAFILSLSLLAGIVFLIYWFFFARVPPTPVVIMQYCEIEDREIPSIEWSSEKCIPLPEIRIPAPPFTASRIETIEITTQNELPVYLTQILEQDVSPGIFQKITIKDLSQWRVVRLAEFFSIFKAKAPEDLYLKLNPEFFFFLYWQEQAPSNENETTTKEPRIVIVARIIEQEELLKTLRFWEDTMEMDTDQLFRFFGKINPAKNAYFSPTTHRGTSIRCQTYSLNDLGACYTIKGEYFIFTSSLESMRATIDNLPSS